MTGTERAALDHSGLFPKPSVKRILYHPQWPSINPKGKKKMQSYKLPHKPKCRLCTQPGHTFLLQSQHQSLCCRSFLCYTSVQSPPVTVCSFPEFLYSAIRVISICIYCDCNYTQEPIENPNGNDALCLRALGWTGKTPLLRHSIRMGS